MRYLILSLMLTLLLIGCKIQQEQPAEEIELIKDEVAPYVQEKIVYVADSFNSRIQVFDNEGSFIMSFGTLGREEGYFRIPTDVIEKDSRIYVLDKGNNRIQVFDDEYEFLYSFGRSELLYPLGFDIDGDKVYVTNTYKSRIDVYSLNGTPMFYFGKSGRKDGEFRYVSDIAVDDYVYVLDTDNHRIQKFTQNGTFLSSWGKFGPWMKKEEGIRFPLGIEVYNGTIYISDTQSGEVEMYTTNGTLISRFGTFGKGDEQFRFESKLWEVDGMLYIADTKNNRIKAYYPNGTLHNFFGSFGRGEGQFRAPGVVRWFGKEGINKTASTNLTNSSA